MRRHRDIDVGLSPVSIRRVDPGLGSFNSGEAWNSSDVGGADRNHLATKYMSAATADKDFGSSGWKKVRGNWYDVLHFAGYSDDEPKMQNSVVQDFFDHYKSDTDNPSFTDWDNSALGKFFGKTIAEAWKRSNWGSSAPDNDLTNLGNRIALLCYKGLKPDLWPQIYQYMSTTPTRMFTEHLSTLGIVNPTSKPVAFWKANPNFDYKLAAGVTKPSATQEVTIQPPPFDYGKLNATGLALRDGPSASASSIKTLPNPPLYAKVIGVSGGFVKVQLMDGTIGWTASGSDTKAYWLPSSQDEAFGNKQTVVTTNQNVPVSYTVPGAGTTVTQYQDPNAGPPVPVAPVAPEPLVAPEPPVAPVAPAPPETSNTAMYIGVGVGVLVIGGLALMLLKKKD